MPTDEPTGAVDAFRVLRSYPLRWLAPAAVIVALGAVYAAKKNDVWEAAQALIVREEATLGLARPQRTPHAEEVKSSQETILELAKSRPVMLAALTAVGPPANRAGDQSYPTDGDLRVLQWNTKLVPPKGAEFGKTEVFYLKLQDRDRDRAIALATALCDQLQARFMELRKAKAHSLIEELTRAAGLAESDLEKVTRRLALIEHGVGSDLAELRILQESPSGDSQLRRSAIEMEAELRQQRSALKVNEELLTLLKDSQQDAHNLLAAPSRLLDAQPALKRLKDGLVDAQLRTAQLRGLMSDKHPQSLVAQSTLDEINRRLQGEIETSVRGVQLDLRLSQERIEFLENELNAARERMTRVASVRADYGNLIAEVKHRGELLKSAEHELAEARAGQAAAQTASLISRIDVPDGGIEPIGPSRAMILIVAVLGGLLVGCGIAILTAPTARFAAAPVVVAQNVLPPPVVFAPVAPLKPVVAPPPVVTPPVAAPPAFNRATDEPAAPEAMRWAWNRRGRATLLRS